MVIENSSVKTLALHFFLIKFRKSPLLISSGIRKKKQNCFEATLTINSSNRVAGEA